MLFNRYEPDRIAKLSLRRSIRYGCDRGPFSAFDDEAI